MKTYTEKDENKGSLHLNVEGKFNPSLAFNLVATIKNNYHGTGDIFIHTHKATAVEHISGESFYDLLLTSGLPTDRVYFTGPIGHRIMFEHACLDFKRTWKSGEFVSPHHQPIHIH